MVTFHAISFDFLNFIATKSPKTAHSFYVLRRCILSNTSEARFTAFCITVSYRVLRTFFAFLNVLLSSESATSKAF